MRKAPALVLCLGWAVAALGAAGCGSADDSELDQSSDAFRRHRQTACLRAYAECTVEACDSEIDLLRRARPFSKEWFGAFVRTKLCSIRQCGGVCSHSGTGGSGGSAGQGGPGGSGGSGSVCDQAANACQSCMCRPCEAKVAACNADSACRNVVTCGMTQNCSGVDCYYQADGSRGPCADVIDDAGGPAGGSVTKALDALRCTEEARPTCSAGN